MAIKVWIEQGVVWDLQPVAAEGFRQVCKYAMYVEQDVFVTSGREGDHSPNSLHYLGLAWDMRKKGFIKEELLEILPFGDKHWDIVEYEWGFHIEFDPK
jgi:hypothetical protein